MPNICEISLHIWMLELSLQGTKFPRNFCGTSTSSTSSTDNILCQNLTNEPKHASTRRDVMSIGNVMTEMFSFLSLHYGNIAKTALHYIWLVQIYFTKQRLFLKLLMKDWHCSSLSWYGYTITMYNYVCTWCVLVVVVLGWITSCGYRPCNALLRSVKLSSTSILWYWWVAG